MPGVYVLQSPIDTGDTNLPVAVRDALLTGSGGGVKFLFDLAFPWCYPGGPLAGRPAAGAPANGAAIYDMTENGNGSFIAQSGDVTSYAGGGLDFSACAKIGNYVQGAGNFASSVWASANQYFLICMYAKLPTLANWNSSAGIAEMLRFASVGQTYQSGTELALIAQGGGGGNGLSFRRQTGAGTVDQLAQIFPNAADYGSFVQLAYWRDATGQYCRLKSANGTLLQSMAVGANNTQNFSGLTVKAGFVPGFVGNAGATPAAGLTNTMKWRLYRAFCENLFVSGRDATTVIDADYTRTVARNVFS